MTDLIRCGKTKSDGTKCERPVSVEGQWCGVCIAPASEAAASQSVQTLKGQAHVLDQASRVSSSRSGGGPSRPSSFGRNAPFEESDSAMGRAAQRHRETAEAHRFADELAAGFATVHPMGQTASLRGHVVADEPGSLTVDKTLAFAAKEGKNAILTTRDGREVRGRVAECTSTIVTLRSGFLGRKANVVAVCDVKKVLLPGADEADLAAIAGPECAVRASYEDGAGGTMDVRYRSGSSDTATVGLAGKPVDTFAAPVPFESGFRQAADRQLRATLTMNDGNVLSGRVVDFSDGSVTMTSGFGGKVRHVVAADDVDEAFYPGMSTRDLAVMAGPGTKVRREARVGFPRAAQPEQPGHGGYPCPKCGLDCRGNGDD